MRGVLSDAVALDAALSYLSKKDKKLAAVIKKARPEPIKKRTFDFASVVSVIISQQLSGSAAKTIYARIVSLCGGSVTSIKLENVTDEQIRQCGISTSKVNFIRALQKHLAKNPHYFNIISDMLPDDAMLELKKLKGIGEWTASILVLFYLQHPDIFPIGDASLNKAIRHIYGIEPYDHELVVPRWAPYRSVASVCLWRFIDIGALESS